MVELIVVIVVIGIMSATVSQRFNGTSVYASSAFKNGLIESLRFARQSAVAWQCYVRVQVDLNNDVVNFHYNAADCRSSNLDDMPDQMPDGSSISSLEITPLTLDIPSGVSVSPSDLTLYFDPEGRPVNEDSALLTTNSEITIGGQHEVTVYFETGAVL